MKHESSARGERREKINVNSFRCNEEELVVFLFLFFQLLHANISLEVRHIHYVYVLCLVCFCPRRFPHSFVGFVS